MKGTLTSIQVADAAERGVKQVMPCAHVVKVPIADGGEGTAEVLVSALGGEMIEKVVTGPLGHGVTARYGLLDDGTTAVIEMASAAGLGLVPAELRNPMTTTTRGVGELMLDALDRGCRKMLMCIGGSATNDGGMGMLEALGVRFLDRYVAELRGVGKSLGRVSVIVVSSLDQRMAGGKVVVACDVDSPLYGHYGAAFMFAPHKGATPQMVADLDAGLRNYGRVLAETLGHDVGSMAGAGAAGGMGAGLMGVLGAHLERGIDLVLRELRFDRRIRGASLVITGEGSIDAQTLHGKAPLGVLRLAEREGVPTIAVAGRMSDRGALLDAGFADVVSINAPGTPLSEAMEGGTAQRNVSRTVASIVVRFFDGA